MRSLVLALLVALSLGGTATASPPADRPVIQLLDAGKGAKKKLRFTATKGMKRSVTMTMEMGLEMRLNGQALPSQKLPPMRMTMDFVVTQVARNGDLRFEFVVRDSEVVLVQGASPLAATALESSLKGMDGMRGHMVVTSRGFAKEAKFALPANANPQTQQLLSSFEQSISQLAAPMPEEAVGLGASWTTTTKATHGGIALEQLATTEVVQLEAKQVGLRIALTQTAKPQTFTANGITLDLESLSSHGSGETLLELDRVVPTKVTMNLHSAMSMKATGHAFGMIMDVSMMMQGK